MTYRRFDRSRCATEFPVLWLKDPGDRLLRMALFDFFSARKRLKRSGNSTCDRAAAKLAMEYPRVLKEPAPTVVLLGFGDNGIDLDAAGMGQRPGARHGQRAPGGEAQHVA